jgi:ADP-sugar diphosphatase
VLTVQARIAAGSMTFVELPAGMLDDGTFAGTAAHEIKEECGIDVSENELINMSELSLDKTPTSESGLAADGLLGTGFYPSPGACDEHMAVFLCQKTVLRKDLKNWQGRLTGLREEGEKITLKLVPLNDIWRVAARDGKALVAVLLYEKLKASKLIN